MDEPVVHLMLVEARVDVSLSSGYPQVLDYGSEAPEGLTWREPSAEQQLDVQTVLVVEVVAAVGA